MIGRGQYCFKQNPPQGTHEDSCQHEGFCPLVEKHLHSTSSFSSLLGPQVKEERSGRYIMGVGGGGVQQAMVSKNCVDMCIYIYKHTYINS